MAAVSFNKRALQGTSGSPKYDPFQIIDINYKHVNNTPIQASVLIPRSIANRPGTYPLIVHWHGGALVTGHRLYAEWYPQWVLDFGLKHNAIVVTADHRLMPEASGLEILEDVRDLFRWLEAGNLAQHLPAGVKADVKNVLVGGESAGG